MATEPSDAELRDVRIIAFEAALSSGAAPHEADEVAQVLLIKFHRDWNEGHLIQARDRDGNGWPNYIRAAARNVHRDHIRSHSRRNLRQRRASGAGDRPVVDRPLVRRERPRDPSGIEQYLARQAVVDAIVTLRSRRQRDCLQMVYLENLSIGEVADELGLDVQTVRFHLRRGLARLRRTLEP